MLPEQVMLRDLDSSKVFSEIKGEFYIGGEKLSKEMRDLLREQARYLETSQLWEILINTLNQRANKMALEESLEWNHILSAKALKIWIDFFEVMIIKLKK